jgi:hypothetical protein
MGRTACTEPQCLYTGALYIFYMEQMYHAAGRTESVIVMVLRSRHLLPKHIHWGARIVCISLDKVVLG